MSLKRAAYLLCFVRVLAGEAHGQWFVDQGLLSGSGLVILPTAATAPPSEFRLQLARLGYLREGGSGASVITLASGFSDSFEGYARLTAEQTGVLNSEVAYGIGAKYRLPLTFPARLQLALWIEKTQSDAALISAIVPPEAFRTGGIATLDLGFFRPTAVIGWSGFSGESVPLIGAGCSAAAGHQVQLGVEGVGGYLGRSTGLFEATAAIRIVPNASLHISPGYLTTPAVSTWTFSFGVSCTTSAIDFHPVESAEKANENIVPSLEEIEKELRKSPGADTLNNGGSKRL